MTSPPHRSPPPPAAPPPGSAAPGTPLADERLTARRRGHRRDVRTVLSIAGPLFFLPPALAVADRGFAFLGIPSLILYVFAVWLAGIVLIAVSASHDPLD